LNRWVFCFCLMLLMVLLCPSQGVQITAAPASQEDVPLRVAVKLLPPFVLVNDDGFSGFSIDLWDALAAEIGVDFQTYEVKTVGDQLAAVQNGDADIAIAGITITEEREELVDFTYPYFDSGLQIMVHSEEASPLENTLRTILSPTFLQFLLIFLLLILITSHIYWLFERRHPEFPRPYFEGIKRVLWWTTVTVIGYDDLPPATRLGRFVALLWMFAGIFLIANLTASLSAGATVRELRSSIQSLADLQGQRVATVAGSTSANYLDRRGISYIGVATIVDTYDLLLKGQIDAIVYDAPVLRYYLTQTRNTDLELVGATIETEKYGIALPTGSPYREPINRAILKLLEDGTYQQLYTRWFGTAPV
jgi:polar amino acid transport system substrate-binding protein